MEQEIKKDWAAYVQFMKDNIMEQMEELDMSAGIMVGHLEQENKQLRDYIEQLCDSDCPSEYRNVIYNEVIKGQNGKTA